MAFVNFEVESELSTASIEKAARELNETDDIRDAKILELKNRIEQSEDKLLVDSRKDEAFLLRFLRARKFDVDRTYQLVVNYFRYRHDHPEIFSEQFTAKDMREVLESGLISVGPKTKEGQQVIYFQTSKWDLDKVSVDDITRCLVITMEAVIESPEVQVNGIVVIRDHEGMTLRQARSMSTADRKKVTHLMQDAFPARIKGIHIVHQGWFLRIFFALIKPFLKAKIKDRIFFHGSNYENLHRLIDPSNLPANIGGELTEIDPRTWAQYLLKRERQEQVE